MNSGVFTCCNSDLPESATKKNIKILHLQNYRGFFLTTDILQSNRLYIAFFALCDVAKAN